MGYRPLVSLSVKAKFFLLAVAAIIMIATFALRGRSNETAVWQELFQRLPARPLTPAEIQITDEAVSARMTPENDEVGHIQPANGDIWRFAFRSHLPCRRPQQLFRVRRPTRRVSRPWRLLLLRSPTPEWPAAEGER
jgi:hypothetical protein